MSTDPDIDNWGAPSLKAAQEKIECALRLIVLEEKAANESDG